MTKRHLSDEKEREMNKELDARMNEISHRNFLSLCLGLTILYFAFVIGHLFFFKTKISSQMAIYSAITMIITFSLFLLLYKKKSSLKRTDYVGFILIILVLFNSIIYMNLTHDPLKLVNVLLLLLATGFFFLTFKTYILSTFLILTITLIDLASYDFVNDWNTIMASIVITFYISFFVNYLRISSVRKFELLYLDSKYNQKVLQKTLDELKKAKEKSELINRVVPSAVFLVDKECQVISWNNKAEQITGYSKEEIVGKKCTKFADEPCACGCDLLENNAQYPITGVECTITTKKGEKRIISKNADILKDEKGEIIGAIESFEDITEKNHAERTLRESEKRFKDVSLSIADWIWEVDINNRYIYCSEQVENILGYRVQEMIGEKPFGFAPEEDRQEIKNIYERIWKSKESFKDLENTKVRKNGEVVFLSTSGVPVYNQKNELIGYRGVDKNITEQKKIEELKANLIQKLEAVNSELKEFAYVVSHDLKAPLRGVFTLATWIKEDYADKFDKKGLEEMDLLMNRVKRMDQLINGILQYSRIGRTEEEKVEIDLNQEISQIINSLNIPSHIEVEIDTTLPTLEIARTRLNQIFQNLLSNAINYNDKKKGMINIGCHESDDDWKFYIKDNGPGIPKKYFKRIFQIFQTLQSKDKKESTGIGLTTIKKIIEMYDGKIWLDSKVGEGTTFYFTLPKVIKKEK